MEQPRLKPKQPKSVRWLSHDAARDTMKKILPSIVISLHKEAAGRKDPVAIGLVKLCECWEFVIVLNLMCDTLSQLSSLSRFFQAGSI